MRIQKKGEAQAKDEHVFSSKIHGCHTAICSEHTHTRVKKIRSIFVTIISDRMSIIYKGKHT
jgi:hypothetical protein